MPAPIPVPTAIKTKSRTPWAGADLMLRNGRCIHIVFNRRRNTQAGLQQCAQRNVAPPHEIGSGNHDAFLHIRDARARRPQPRGAEPRSIRIFPQQIFHAFVNQSYDHMRIANARSRNLPLGHNLAIHTGESKAQAGAPDVGAYDITRFNLLRIPNWHGRVSVATSTH